MNRRLRFGWAAGILFAFFIGILWVPGYFLGEVSASAIKDTESASHVDTAATQDLVNTYEYNGVKILQFNLAVLSHYSYMVVSGGDAMVVDPDRDIQVYLDTAKKQGWKIKGVFLSHSNADFVAGHIEFLKASACPIYQSKDSGAEYKIVPLSHEQTMDWGEATIRFLATPGHTPDGMSALIFSQDDPRVAKVILTGDTLFVGSVGRPDLMGGTMAASTLAGMSYDTWTHVLSKLDDSVVVLPAHGAGSLCGAHLRDEPSSTIGLEKATNPYLKHTGKNDFITRVLDGLPQAPPYFKHNAAMNRKGPAPVDWKAEMPASMKPVSSLSDISKFYVIDLRDSKRFAAGHIPNSVNIALRGRLETWTGIMAPWGSNIVLCGSADEIKEARFRLQRIGYDAVGAIFFETWKNSKNEIFSNEPISPRELYRSMQDGSAPVIIDVRLPTEWMGLRIGNVLNLPINQLSEWSAKLDPSDYVVTVCNSAYRSSMGIGVLERKGFKKVASMEGGGEAWLAAGLPVIQPIGPGQGGAAAKRAVRLPEVVDPQQVKRMLMDLPGTFDLVDVRPPEYFKDYHLPGAVNVDIADLIANPAFLTGTLPLVIVDRNGSLAMMAGGILSQKTERRILTLFGGLNAYWNVSEMGSPVKAVPMMAPGAPAPSMPYVPAAPMSPAPKKPKKKSAGC